MDDRAASGDPWSFVPAIRDRAMSNLSESTSMNAFDLFTILSKLLIETHMYSCLCKVCDTFLFV